ncbi:ABC transporter substrate-binding protein [Chloroflexota bacterium]
MKGKMRSKLLLFPLVFLAVIGLIVVSCAPTSTPAPAPTAKPEGTLVFGANSLGTERMLHWTASFQDTLLSMPVNETLCILDPKTVPVPSLATRWEYSTDYRTFTIYLREGVQFQGGWGEVTADDVKYTIERVLADDSLIAMKGSIDAAIDTMEVKDKYTLVCHLKKPSTDLVNYLVWEGQNLLIASKNYLETVGDDEANLNPIGSGPYRLVERRSGDYFKYEAFDEHWRVVPEFKYLIIRGVPEESTRVAMLKTGEIDATVISPPSVPEIPEQGFKVLNWPGGPYSFLIFGGFLMPEDDRYVEGYHNQDPWLDIRVREAMNIAIDREAINQALEGGTARVMPILWQILGWEEIEPYPYNPERAKQLLTEAGYPNGFSLDMINPPFQPGVPMFPKEQEAIAGYWENIGIHVNIIPMEFGVWYPQLKNAEDAGTIWSMRFSYTPDYTGKVERFTPNGAYGMYQREEIADMSKKIVAELDMKKKDALWREMAKYMHDEYIAIPLLNVALLIATDNQKIGDWPPSYTSGFYFNFEYARHAKPLNTWRLFDL